jgi:hypothetical protein
MLVLNDGTETPMTTFKLQARERESKYLFDFAKAVEDYAFERT